MIGFSPAKNIITQQTVSIVDTGNISPIMLKVFEEKQLEVEKYVADNKEDYEDVKYLKMIGIDKCNNVQCFDYRKYDRMLDFLKIFKTKKVSVLEQYPFIDHYTLDNYCDEKNLKFKRKGDYYGEISKSNIGKLKKHIDILEKGLPTEEFFKIKYGDYSRAKWDCDEKQIKNVIGKINKNKEEFKEDTVAIGEDFVYQIFYREIWVIENEEKTAGFFTMELYDKTHVVLFDWDENGKTLDFKGFVEKNKLTADEAKDSISD